MHSISIIITMVLKNLPSAQHHSQHFIYINSLNPPQISSKNILHNAGNIANTITGNGI